jgi:thiosulfate/3-mercaptopyruvate sulfurtransferase
VVYDAGHIPGAIHVDLDTELVASRGPGRHPLPDPTTFARAMAVRGIGDGDIVVAYDDVGGWVAARLGGCSTTSLRCRQRGVSS